MLKTWSFWKTFITTYIALVGGIWGFMEAYTYFRGDALKQLLGSSWWLLYYVIPALIAFSSATLRHARGEAPAEQLEQRNRRVMLDHVENFWVKGILEKSLHGAALIELGIKEELGAVRYPWTIKKESTGEVLPPGKSMLEIFREVGAGRSLLVLGAPGAGKTTMLIELARQLIQNARDSETEPIPVVFHLASWTEKQTLADWLAEQLNQVYYVPKKITPSWVAEDRMLLLLDGLDEVREDSRAGCVDAINAFRAEHGFTSLAVCSRIQEYTAINTKLAFEGAITIQPLTPEQVDAYIDRLGSGMGAVRLALRKDRELRELAKTPLMLSIMAIVYKDTRADDLPGSGTLEAREARRHLFDRYVDRMFERSTRSANPLFTKGETLHYLGWLARAMIRHNITTYQIEAMQPSWLEKKSDVPLYKLIVGMSIGLMVGLMVGLIIGLLGGLDAGLNVGLIFGLSVGLVAGLIGTPDRIMMVDSLKWSWKEAWSGLMFGLSICLLLAFVGGLLTGMSRGQIGGLIMALYFGLIGGLMSWLMGGLRSNQIEETSYPWQRLKQTFYNGLFSTLIFGLIGGLMPGLIDRLIFRLLAGLLEVLVFGLIFGLVFGLLGGLIYGYHSFIQHYVLRWLLTRRHLLPRHLFPFLEYCVSLIFLRRAGGSYIFVHRLLMEHFAGLGMPQGEPPGAVPGIVEQVEPPPGGMPPLGQK